MIVKLVCAAKNLKFSKENTVFDSNNDTLISNNTELLKSQFLFDTFLVGIGSINADVLFNSPFAFFNYEIETPDSIDLGGILESGWGPLQLFQLASWLVKDNSINFDTLFLFEPQHNIVISNRRNIWFSNSNGRYVDCNFNDEELEEILVWQSKIISYLNSSGIEQTEVDLVEDFGNHQYRYSSTNNYYSNMNRISRALRFIMVARSESFAPMKITGYVGALESLFSTGHNEITHQISERVAKFVGGDIVNRITNYNLIKDVYSVRSSYVHGSGLGEKTLRKLNDISPSLDELVREVMKKLLTEQQAFAKKSEKELRDWFLKLILE